MKHSREKRKSKTEKAVRKGLRDVFDMPLTDVGRLVCYTAVFKNGCVADYWKIGS